MDTKYYLTTDYAPDGVAVKVLERDLTGNLIAEYTGYRRSKRGVFTLYPKHNPFALNNGKLIKHEISDRLVLYPIKAGGDT